MNEIFRKFASRSSEVLGSPWAFLIAAVSIVVWGATGPLFHFSDTWQLLANTGTTLVTFLMVFLIQNTQNRDAKAIHLKLDELIRGVKGARTRMVDLEDLSDAELAELQKQFQGMHERLNNKGVKVAQEVAADTVKAGEVAAATVKAGKIEAEQIEEASDDEPDDEPDSAPAEASRPSAAQRR